MLCYDQVKIKCDSVIFRFLSRIRNVDWKGVGDMTASERFGIQLLEETAKNETPTAYELALRMMEASEGLGATAQDFDQAVAYVQRWTKSTQRVKTAGTTIAEVLRHRDAVLKELQEL